jgi:hypothetical protein
MRRANGKWQMATGSLQLREYPGEIVRLSYEKCGRSGQGSVARAYCRQFAIESGLSHAPNYFEGSEPPLKVACLLRVGVVVRRRIHGRPVFGFGWDIAQLSHLIAFSTTQLSSLYKCWPRPLWGTGEFGDEIGAVLSLGIECGPTLNAAQVTKH